jgi:hypothetical protein
LSGSYRRPAPFPGREGRTPFCAPGSMRTFDRRRDGKSSSNLHERRLGPVSQWPTTGTGMRGKTGHFTMPAASAQNNVRSVPRGSHRCKRHRMALPSKLLI